MARRNTVIVILILVGAIAALFFFSRSREKKSELQDMTASAETKPTSVTASTNEEPRNPAAKENESTQTTESSSSDQPKTMSRGAIPKNFGQAQSAQVSTENVQFVESTLLEETPWKVWKNVKAVPLDIATAEKNLGSLNGYNLVEAASDVDLHNFSRGQALVVYDPRLNNVGLVTGIFSVTLKEGISEDVLTQASGLKILNSYPNIRLYYVTSEQSPFDLLAFQSALKKEPAFENVQLMVEGRPRGKN